MNDGGFKSRRRCQRHADPAGVGAAQGIEQRSVRAHDNTPNHAVGGLAVRDLAADALRAGNVKLQVQTGCGGNHIGERHAVEAAAVGPGECKRVVIHVVRGHEKSQ